MTSSQRGRDKLKHRGTRPRTEGLQEITRCDLSQRTIDGIVARLKERRPHRLEQVVTKIKKKMESEGNTPSPDRWAEDHSSPQREWLHTPPFTETPPTHISETKTITEDLGCRTTTIQTHIAREKSPMPTSPPQGRQNQPTTSRMQTEPSQAETAKAIEELKSMTLNLATALGSGLHQDTEEANMAKDLEDQKRLLQEALSRVRRRKEAYRKKAEEDRTKAINGVLTQIDKEAMELADLVSKDHEKAWEKARAHIANVIKTKWEKNQQELLSVMRTAWRDQVNKMADRIHASWKVELKDKCLELNLLFDQKSKPETMDRGDIKRALEQAAGLKDIRQRSEQPQSPRREQAKKTLKSVVEVPKSRQGKKRRREDSPSPRYKGSSGKPGARTQKRK